MSSPFASNPTEPSSDLASGVSLHFSSANDEIQSSAEEASTLEDARSGRKTWGVKRCAFKGQGETNGIKGGMANTF
jgi:hypothetical protein